MAAESARIDDLLHTALYDTGGESVEGAFVDHWVSNASTAIEELEAIFGKHGFSPESAAQVAAAIRSPPGPSGTRTYRHCPAESAVKLLTWLKKFTAPLTAELLTDSAPHVRAIAVLAAADLLKPEAWLSAMVDSAPEVRAAAVSALARRNPNLPDAGERIAALLSDSDPLVRSQAAKRLGFINDPQAAMALVNSAESESVQDVQSVMVDAIAEGVYHAGIHVRGDRLASVSGPSVKQFLIGQLGHEDSIIRQKVIRALARIGDLEVTKALFDRLLVEDDLSVRAELAKYEGYGAIAERSFPVLAQIIRSDPEMLMRIHATYALTGFGARAVPVLIDALDDPDGPKRAAALMIGWSGEDLRALPSLLREYGNPENRRDEREYQGAIRSVVATAGGHPTAERKAYSLSSEQQAIIQRLIDNLTPESYLGWIARHCKEDLEALPIYSAMLYVWAAKADGSILTIDYEPFRLPDWPEEDPLVRFAVMVKGGQIYPELREMIPPPPVGTEVCGGCMGRGWYRENETDVGCMPCSGLGWRLKKT